MSFSDDLTETKTSRVLLPHLAGQPGLVKGPVGRNQRGVAQERHRQLGCYGELKTQSRRKEYWTRRGQGGVLSRTSGATPRAAALVAQ